MSDDIDKLLDEILTKHLQEIKAGHDSKLAQAIKHLIDTAVLNGRIDELNYWFYETGHPAQYIDETSGFVAVRAKTPGKVTSITLPKEFNKAVAGRLAELKGFVGDTPPAHTKKEQL